MGFFGKNFLKKNKFSLDRHVRYVYKLRPEGRRGEDWQALTLELCPVGRKALKRIRPPARKC
jgi:hypothetical protein